MWREDLYVPPGEADQIRLKLRHDLPDGAASLRHWMQRQIQDALADIWFPTVNKIGQIGDADGVHPLAGKKYIKHGIHQLEVDK